jgi:DNA-binding NtrC family response regulator
MVKEKYSSGSDQSCVLIIDDEVETTEEIAFKLSNHGFQCLIAHDATSALQLFDDEPRISIVISDIRMPGMDGLELCRILKSRYEGERDLALLMVTGHAGIDEAVEALKVGVLDFLTKPLHPHHLVHAVKRAE